MKLLVQGEKICFDFSVVKEKYVFLTKFCLKGLKRLFEASCVEEDIDWFCVLDSTSKN